jgi:DNA-binding CsgD family transcriptional regulator
MSGVTSNNQGGNNPENAITPTLERILKQKYQLTKSEAAICLSVVSGKKIEEILHLHTITRNTYKTHLKHIFSKTIDRQNGSVQKNHGKLLHLTWFLMNLKKEL